MRSASIVHSLWYAIIVALKPGASSCNIQPYQKWELRGHSAFMHINLYYRHCVRPCTQSYAATRQQGLVGMTRTCVLTHSKKASLGCKCSEYARNVLPL